MHLVRADATLLEAALAGDDALAAAIGVPVVSGWASFVEALAAVRNHVVSHPDSVEWGTRFFVDGDPPAVVGWGGFKGAPVDGTVELGYEISADVQGRGLATAAVRAMLDEAFADPDVDRVMAHTLAEPNASNHILEKLGFTRTAELMDGDQPVWRFESERSPLP